MKRLGRILLDPGDVTYDSAEQHDSVGSIPLEPRNEEVAPGANGASENDTGALQICQARDDILPGNSWKDEP